MPAPARSEKSIEDAVTRWATNNGISHRKMNGLGNRDWPDQLFFSKRFRDGVKAVWIEFKRVGKDLTEKQYDKIEELRAAGFDAEMFDDVKAAKNYLLSFLR